MTGILPGLADQCILGDMYLTSSLHRNKVTAVKLAFCLVGTWSRENCWSHALQSVTAFVLIVHTARVCSVKALALNLHVTCLMKQHDKLIRNSASELIF